MFKLPYNNSNYTYLVLIPKFYKNPAKFRTVTIGRNTYSNNGSKFLLNIIKQIYNLTMNNNSHCLKKIIRLMHLLISLQI